MSQTMYFLLGALAVALFGFSLNYPAAEHYVVLAFIMAWISGWLILSDRTYMRIIAAILIYASGVIVGMLRPML